MQFIASRASGVGSVVVILEKLREVKINGGVKTSECIIFVKFLSNFSASFLNEMEKGICRRWDCIFFL